MMSDLIYAFLSYQSNVTVLHVVLSAIVCIVWIALYVHNRVSINSEEASKKFHVMEIPIPNVGVGFPFFGNVFQLDMRRPDLTLMKWTKTIGPVYSLNVLHEKWIIVGGYDELRDMLVTQGQAFAGRQRSNMHNFRFDLHASLLSRY